MRAPQAIFFDFDGVILESLDVKTEAMASLFADRPEHLREIMRYHVENAGMPRYDKFRRYYKELFHEPLSDERMSELDLRFGELIWTRMRKVPFVAGALEFLEAWASRIPCFVVSAAPQREVLRIIEERGLSMFFRSAHGSPESKKEHLGRLLRDHGLTPSGCLFVGDGKADFEAAKAFGVPFIQRLTRHAPAPFDDSVLAALNDLRGLSGLWEDGKPVLARAPELLHQGGPAPAARRSGSWVFLGRDFRMLRRWEERLGPAWTRLDLSAGIQASAGRLRAPYLDWIETLNERHGKDPDWWTTQVSEKNPLADPFFLHACCLSALRDSARGRKLPDVVVCEDWGLLRALELMLSAEGLRAPRRGRCRHALSRAGDAGKLALRSLEFAVQAAWSTLVAALTRSAAPAPVSGRPTAILATFVHEPAARRSPQFADRYFPGIEAWLERQGLEVWLLPTLQGFNSRGGALRWLRRAKNRFLIQEDWLAPSDYLATLRGAWRTLSLPRAAPPLMGLELAPLLSETRRRQARSAEALQARLTFRLMPRLAAAGMRPKLVLSWFENHKIEKALALGVRHAFPAAEHIGYFCMLPNPNYLAPFPLRTEREAGALPGSIVCCGGKQASILESHGSGLAFGAAAALRYRHLWEAAREPAAAARRTALVALPNRLCEAAGLLEILSPVLDLDCGVENWNVKPHPDYGIEELKACLGRWPERFVVRDEPIGDLLDQSGVVLSGGSGALVEAACRGLPVLFVGNPIDLDFNPLSWFPGLALVCRSPEEVARELRGAMDLDEAGRERLRAKGLELRGLCFEQVSEAALSPFAGASAGRGLPAAQGA